MRLENADNFEGFHISQPSYWIDNYHKSDIGMVIVTCNKCGHRAPVTESKIPITTSIKCSNCGFKSIINKEVRIQ